MSVSKDTVKKVKRHATKWEKMFVTHMTNKGPVPKQY